MGRCCCEWEGEEREERESAMGPLEGEVIPCFVGEGVPRGLRWKVIRVSKGKGATGECEKRHFINMW